MYCNTTNCVCILRKYDWLFLSYNLIFCDNIKVLLEERSDFVASLTHVRMWSKNNWKRITASEAANLHPSGTVSAHSGLFMCDLCGQYVLLTKEGTNERHFRHSSSEKSKDCPERRFGAGVSITYSVEEYELPIRLMNVRNSDFELEMGFIPLPSDLRTTKMRVEIKSNSCGFDSYIYSGERINREGITYLPIGKNPAEKYYLLISGASDDIYRFWPKEIQGIDPQGTIFDADTGKKLVYDSDVEIKKKYYLLRKGSIGAICNLHVNIREIVNKQISWSNWYVYEVIAQDFDETSAQFFLDYHCRLTERPVSLIPVWPIYVENPYIIKHNQNNMLMYISGNATSKVFPNTITRNYSCKDSNLLEIFCNDRQQMISVGRTKILQYTYFWKENLDKTTTLPEIVVTDNYGNKIRERVCNDLPDEREMVISIPYDGMVIIKKKGIVVEKKLLQAKKKTVVDDITWNIEISVLVGLDCIWKTSFLKNESNVADKDEDMYARLKSFRGNMIRAPHSLKNIATILENYPLVRQWIYQCIKNGIIDKRAYKELQTFVLRVKGC